MNFAGPTTSAAHDAIEVAERVLRDIDPLGTGLKDLSALRRGRVTIAVTPTLGEILLPSSIQSFRQHHPDVHVDIDDCAPDQLISRVIGEQADFGLGTPVRPGDGVEMQRLLGDHLSLVCRQDDPFVNRRVVRWADLHRLPVITVWPGYGIRPLIEQSAGQAGISLNVAHNVTFLATALWMTSAGLGPSIMPAAYVSRTRNPELITKALVAPKVSRDISVVIKQGRTLSPAAKEFLQVLRDTTRLME